MKLTITFFLLAGAVLGFGQTVKQPNDKAAFRRDHPLVLWIEQHCKADPRNGDIGCHNGAGPNGEWLPTKPTAPEQCTDQDCPADSATFDIEHPNDGVYGCPKGYEYKAPPKGTFTTLVCHKKPVAPSKQKSDFNPCACYASDESHPWQEVPCEFLDPTQKTAKADCEAKTVKPKAPSKQTVRGFSGCNPLPDGTHGPKGNECYVPKQGITGAYGVQPDTAWLGEWIERNCKIQRKQSPPCPEGGSCIEPLGEFELHCMGSKP